MNISGMLLPVAERVRDGDRFTLTLILSQDPLKVVRCVARVARTCPLAEGRKGAGLQFVENRTSGPGCHHRFLHGGSAPGAAQQGSDRDLSI
ncbi:MAG: hypothetical protein R2864_03960 [Syntrophotaleaceae bacterium]